MSYVDGYVLPVPKDKVELYRGMAQHAGEIWKEYGALSYKECVLDHTNIEDLKTFDALAGTSANETVVFAYILYRDRAHRDEVNAKVMADPRLHAYMEGKDMPFDMKRMAYGGFNVLVDL